MFTISSFKSIKSKHDIYKGKDCMKRFCECFREHAMEVINFEKKKMKLLTNEQQESNQNSKVGYFSKKNLKRDMLQIKNIVKLGTIVIM